MTSPTNSERCLHYLKSYAAKDLKAIDDLFAEDITLRDWKIRVAGKKAVLNETRKNFQAAEHLSIDVLATTENENTVAAELKIVIDNKEELFVVDVITFDNSGKITSIRAYLGRGDD